MGQFERALPELAVILPTFNERDNLEPMMKGLSAALSGIEHEVVIVDDDSEDGTAHAARKLSEQDPRIRVVQRINRRGLASACIEGMMATHAPFLAVMDADLQHDESILPSMLTLLKTEKLDIVVGTRLSSGGSMGEFAASRKTLSGLGKRVSSLILRTPVSDPMSGFFVLTRSFLEEVVRSLSASGFKILLDLLASSRRPVHIGEVGYTFRKRNAGASKLDILVGLEYVELILQKLIGDWIPVSYVVFGIVGFVGAVVYLGLMKMLFVLLPVSFLSAQGVASVAAMTANFFLNNHLTFRSHRLRGGRLITGLLVFYVASAFGLFVNLRVAEFLGEASIAWYFAGLAGIAVGSIWNYWISSLFVWRVRQRRLARRRSSM